MTPRQCFTNSQRTVLGLTALDPAGLAYAEGYALSRAGMWSHHGWLVTPAGKVIDRTWKLGAVRYVGVPVLHCDEDGRCSWLRPPDREPGLCQLAPSPAGFAWAPGMTPEAASWLFQDTPA